MTNKKEDVAQYAETITNLILDNDVNEDELKKLASKKTREAYRHITIKGVAVLTLGSFFFGILTSCSVINFSVLRYHDLILERDVLAQKHVSAVLTANQNSLDAMRDSLEKMAVTTTGMNYTLQDFETK